MIFLDNIPAELQAIALTDPRAVVLAADALQDRDLGLLMLWSTYVENEKVEHAEYGRVLAIECGRPSRGGVAQACRLWLMAKGTDDLGILHTLIGHLQKEIVEQRAWPSFLAGQLLDFLRHACAHAETSVKAETLALLALAVKRGLLGKIVYAGAAISFADTLTASFESCVTAGDLEPDELAELATLDTFLRKEMLPAAPVLDSRSLQRLTLDLMDSIERCESMVDGSIPLLDLVRERALFDDAGARVARSGSPLQTIRVRSQHAAVRLVEAILGFGEAVVAANRNPDFVDMDAPDYGLQLSWAPAASVPIHVSYDHDDARSVFEILESLVESRSRRARFGETVTQLPPSVATAILRVLQKLEQHDGEIEIVLTDPRSSNWQRRVVITRATFGRESLSSLMRQSREAARTGSLVVPKDQVPQANTVRQVFQAVDAMVARGVVTADDIDDINSQRQVDYYKQGARVLGFFDADNQPTSRARSIIGVEHGERLTITAIYFEDSVIGRAWRSWAGSDHLLRVNPTTAEEFLQACVVGLTGTTPARRASTLRAWYGELMPNYPAGGE